MDHKCKITSFLFLPYSRFLKNENWFNIPNPNLKFTPFVYIIWATFFFKDFVFVGTGLIIEVDEDLNRSSSWEEKSR